MVIHFISFIDSPLMGANINAILYSTKSLYGVIGNLLKISIFNWSCLSIESIQLLTLVMIVDFFCVH